MPASRLLQIKIKNRMGDRARLFWKAEPRQRNRQCIRSWWWITTIRRWNLLYMYCSISLAGLLMKQPRSCSMYINVVSVFVVYIAFKLRKRKPARPWNMLVRKNIRCNFNWKRNRVNAVSLTGRIPTPCHVERDNARAWICNAWTSVTCPDRR